MISKRSEARSGSLYLEEVLLRAGGDVHDAVVFDFSTYGLQISLLERPSVEVGQHLSIDVFDGDTTSVWPMVVRWIRLSPDGVGCRIGLQSDQPIPDALASSASLDPASP